MRKICRALVLCVLLLGLLPLSAQAGGIVTDTLTVKVGYYGMKSDKYVEAGTYHWTELSEKLALYDEAYTFYRPGDDGKTAWWWTPPGASISTSCWNMPASI